MEGELLTTMTMVRVRVVNMLLGAIVLLSPAVGRSQSADPAQVEELIRQGNDLRRSGKDHAAVPVFRKAYDLERSARTAAQLGLVESQMGYWVASEQHLQEALAFSRHPWLEKNRAVVEQTLAKVQSYIGELDVFGAPTGAEVLINGKAVATLPLARPVRVAEGPVQVGLQAPGHITGTTTVTIEGGQRQSVRLSLQPGADPGAPGGRPVAGSAGSGEPGVPGAGGRTDLSESAASRSPAGWLRPAAWAATVGAVAGLAVGGYSLRNQWKARDDFDNHIEGGVKPCATGATNKGGTHCLSLYNQAQSAGTLAIVGFAAGGVLATGAVIGFLMSAGDAPDAGRGGDMAFGAAVDRQGAEFRLALRF